MNSYNNGAVIDYGMGLDLGNGSVGWVAMDKNYRLMRAKGKELIGARLFNPAQTAADRRGFRTTRRRLSRRRWRLRMLDELFAPALSEVDPNFLARRKYSWVHPKDELNHENWYGGLVFNTREEDKKFFDEYPTIYHLRKALIEDDSKHDIREVYMAAHHIIKYRGNFLNEGEIHSDGLLNEASLMKLLNDILTHNFEVEPETELLISRHANSVLQALENQSINRTARVEQAMQNISVEAGDVDVKQADKILKAIFTALVGNTLRLDTIFSFTDLDKESIAVLKAQFGSANYEDDFQRIIDSGLLNEDEIDLFARLQRVYESLVLKQILGDQKYLSDAQIESYEIHHKNLETFRSIAVHSGMDKKEFSQIYKDLIGSNDERRKKARKIFEEKLLSQVVNENEHSSYMTALDEQRLFPLQRSSDNGVIPYQLHLNELRRILQNQGKYYPFLLDTYEKNGKQVNKIEGLLEFRIPYYVGPLVSPDDMNANDNSENHWMVRKPGHTGAITPWNFDDVVDKDQSGKLFIDRLTGTDTFLLGEKTLPQHSLLYEEYMVLSELNNVRMSARVGKHYSDKKRQRLGYEEKQFLIDELFKTRKTVSKDAAEKCLMRHNGGLQVEIFGLADEKKFTSSLDSYIDLSKALGKDFVENKANFDLLEKIIELQTVFEDRSPLVHQLSLLDGLNEEQRKRLSNTYYTGWGRLSKKLLTTACVRKQLTSIGDVFTTEHSIISVMRSESLNLMEIIRDKETGAAEWIDRQNLGQDTMVSAEERLRSLIDDLAISPKAKRGVYQAIRVVDDVTKAFGNPPQRIFIEMADEVQESRRTQSRKSRLDSIFASSALKKEFKNIAEQLKNENNTSLQDDKLYLYYIQLGKDMYTGKEINLERLQDYDIDHIIPHAMTKDDSIENRVLVNRVENARKSDSALYTPELIGKMFAFWSKLRNLKLMGDKKFNALIRTADFSQREKERFVNRSLVETRQIMKNVSTVLRAYYGDELEVYSLNAEITKDMRRYLGFSHKNRDINDMHHAQDALCIAAAGQYMINREFFSKGNVSDNAGNTYNVYLADYLAGVRAAKAAENSKPFTQRRHINAFGFVVGSMMSQDMANQANHRTGEIVWSENDADYLRNVMNYKKMLITKRVGDVKSHALYNESRYGSDDVKASIPFDKKRKDVNLYGGFSGASTSGMMLVYHKKKARLVSVTEAESSLLRIDKDEAVKRILQRNKMADARVILDWIAPGQLMKYSGAYVTIQSAGELNTAIQMWLPKKDYDVIDIIVKSKDEGKCEEILQKISGKHLTADEFMRGSFDTIIHTINTIFPLHTLTDNEVAVATESFGKLDFSQKQAVLLSLLKALHANAENASLKVIGLGDRWKRLHKSEYVLSSTDELIFQSPSGIFESRVSVEELMRRAGVLKE